MPLVTIAIPTYNRANSYLPGALQSALNQTYRNIEILVSDNCSTDDTAALVSSCNDHRIRYIRHQTNIGGNENFNFCIREARGKYFLMLHDDDLIDEDFVEVCMNAERENPSVGLIRTGMRRIDSRGSVLGQSPNLTSGLSSLEFILAWFAGKTPMHLCSTVFNTQCLKEAGGFNSKHQVFQDALAEIRIAVRRGRIDIPEVHASFRRHDCNNTLAHTIQAWCEDSHLLLDEICLLLPESRGVLSREGRMFFFRHNFNLAGRIVSPVKRLRSYLIVFREFNYPVGFFVSRFPPVRLGTRVVQGVRRRLHAALGQGQPARKNPFAW